MEREQQQNVCVCNAKWIQLIEQHKRAHTSCAMRVMRCGEVRAKDITHLGNPKVPPADKYQRRFE